MSPEQESHLVKNACHAAQVERATSSVPQEEAFLELCPGRRQVEGQGALGLGVAQASLLPGHLRLPSCHRPPASQSAWQSRKWQPYTAFQAMVSLQKESQAESHCHSPDSQ